MLKGTIRSRKRMSDGLLIGIKNSNPILHSREHITDFGDVN